MIPASNVPNPAATQRLAGGGELAPADFYPVPDADLLQHPWRCIGRLEARHPDGGAYQHAGTAVLVGRRMILTASHCFRGRAFADGWRFRFTPAYANGAQLRDPAGGFVTRATLTGNVVLGRPGHFGAPDLTSDTAAGWDFAICELAVALGDVWGSLAVFATAGHSYDDVKWTSVGYPVGLHGGEHPIRFPGIDIHGVENDRNGSKEIETDDYVLRGPLDRGKFAKGWSGGPLMSIRGGQWVVAGVMSGSEPDGLDIDGTNVFAGGQRLLDAHREAHQRWSRFDWAGWFPFGGTFHAGDSLAAVERRPGTHEVFGRGTDNRIWQNDYPVDDGWSGWSPSVPGAVAAGPPTALSWSPDHVSVFWVGTDGQGWTSHWYDSAGAWSGPYPLGGSFPTGDGLAVVARRPNTFELFGRGTDDRIWQNDYAVGVHDWTGWTASVPGAVAAGPPTALSWSPDHVSVFWVGTDGQGWTSHWYDSAGAWSGPYPLGGSFPTGDGLAVAARWANTFQLFGRGRDSRVWQNDYAVGVHDWTGWRVTALGATISGTPSALSHHADHVQLYAIDGNREATNTYWGNLDG